MAELTQEQIADEFAQSIEKLVMSRASKSLIYWRARAFAEERGREIERLTIMERAGADAATDLEAQLGEAEVKLHDAESENIGLSARAISAEAALADAHCLLQEAAAAVDPETWPELSAKLADALECGLPQCKHAQEAFEARAKAEAKLVDERHEHALLIEGARQVEDQRDDFERRLSGAQAEIERDRTIVARAVTAIQIAMSARAWLRSGRGRGPYEYDDDRWHEEFGAAFDEIETAMGPLRTVAADMSNAPQDDKAVADVRRAMGAEAHVAKLREALEQISKGEGRFSCDQLEHASNTIEDMTALARAALAASPEPIPPENECDQCDGCGWYEGGETLQTKCEKCKGIGQVPAPPEEKS